LQNFTAILGGHSHQKAMILLIFTPVGLESHFHRFHLYPHIDLIQTLTVLSTKNIGVNN
jgi:hypothetical protein